MSRLSGLQQDVMSLYRRVLREAMKKDRFEQEQHHVLKNADNTKTSNSIHLESYHKSFLELRRHRNDIVSATSADPSIQISTTEYAINEFRKQALSVQRSDFKKIDYMIRKGDKQIRLLRMPGVRLVSSTGTTLSANNLKA